MRKLISILAAVLITATMWAQSPQKMSYQAVIRDGGNKLIISQGVGMRVSILQGSASGTAVYTETKTPTTNANGLVSIEIGGGSGFDAINWGSSSYFIKTETDPTGGTNYTITGTSQLLSVPYALHALSANISYHVSATGDTLDLGNGQHILIPGISAANPIIPTYTLNVSTTKGTVVKNPDLATYTSGATVLLTATPNAGYTFTSWSGDATGSTNPLPVTMTANKTITANFTAVASGFTLNVTATNGTVFKNPNLATYNSGAMVVLTATPNSGYRFTSWSGDVTGSTNPLPVFMTANKTITANFTESDTKALQALIDQCPTNGTVTIPDGTYYIDALISLNLKSNMTLKMESGAILKATPNSSTSYNIIKLTNVSNVIVDGGTVQGERASHTGTTGEWGMGIGILGGSNVTVKNLTAKDCWGDGFYIASNAKNVTLDNVIADNNRRQGLSITSADGVVVKNSIFKNTGGILPECGIDIEPNSGLTVKDVQIIASQILDNKNVGISVNSIAANSHVINLTIDGNTIKGNKGGGTTLKYTGGHKFTNNTVTDTHWALYLIGGSGTYYSIGNTITGNTFTTPLPSIVGDDGTGKNTISGNINL